MYFNGWMLCMLVNHTMDPVSNVTWVYIVKWILTLKEFMTSQKKLYMVGICSTVEKRAKSMPDTLVETTTFKMLSVQLLNFK